jgi:hypothetical protein
MNYESHQAKENLCRIYLEDLETTPATELALWSGCLALQVVPLTANDLWAFGAREHSRV